MTDQNESIHVCLAHEPIIENEIGGQRAGMYNPYHWGENPDISIGFMGGSQHLRERIKQAAEKWISEGGANIKMRFWMDADPATANVRIAFLQRKGSWSYIGKRALSVGSDKPTMNFGWLYDDTDEIELQRVVLHEFGHMLGLIHEHQHPEADINWNKQKVYDYYMNGSNDWTKEKVDNNLFAKYNPENVFRTDFDTDSIMMYAVNAALTTDGFSTEWNSSLSDLDKALIAEAYP